MNLVKEKLKFIAKSFVLGAIFLSFLLITRPVSAQSNCTYYVSPTGSSSSAGTSPSNPTSLQAAHDKTQPGNTVCLMAGTYNTSNGFAITRSGTPDKYITYTNYNGQEAKVVYTGPLIPKLSETGYVYGGVIMIINNTNYIEIRGLKLDAQNKGYDGLRCFESHHIRFINNYVDNGGGCGIVTKRCDYIDSIGNQIYHTGYGGGWGSGISYNSNNWADQYQGIHSNIIGNVISGSYDNSSYITDGNGIIMDLGGQTPPALIANNVVYQNGGRCILSFKNEKNYIINNTCYKSALDTRENYSEFDFNQSTGGYVVNNIAYAWNNHGAYTSGNSQNIVYRNNIYFGTNSSSDTTNNKRVDPKFVAPMVMSDTATQQYNNALRPELLGTKLQLMADSPARNAGIDPTTITAIPQAIRTDIAKYIYSDIRGIARPKSGAFDLGAYQYGSGGNTTPMPSPTPSSIPGDANGDGRVTGLDYSIWLANFNKTVSNGAASGDFNGNNKVDGVDYVIWIKAYVDNS